MFRFTLFLYCLSVSTLVTAQDVEGFFSTISQRISNKEYVTVSGRFGANAALSAFLTDDDDPLAAARRAAPFTWSANAGLNFDILGIQAPFTAAFSSQNATYNLPSYSFVGLSPTYKWITLHGGDRSMTFSPYSLSGINYRGAGLELTPGKFSFRAMTGKLRRARIQDIGSIQDIETAIERRGTGVELGFQSDKGSTAKVSFFTSRDELQSNSSELDSTLNLSPEHNTVLALSLSHKVSKLINFSTELAQSVLTRDTRLPTLADANGRTRQFGLVQPNGSTTASRAAKVAIGFSPTFGNFQLAFERIDPEYRTHGSLYFQNDTENITASYAAPLIGEKLSLSTNIGVQRNDLNGQKANNLRRFIGAVNLGMAFSERVNSSFSASNFISTNRFKAIALTSPLVDSIVLAQTQLSINANTTVVLNEASTQLLSIAANWQRAGLIRNEVLDTSSRSSFALLMLNYTYQPQEGGAAWTATLTTNYNQTAGLNLITVGPTLGYNRKILNDQGSLRTGATYNVVYAEDQPAAGGALQLTLGGGYQLGKRQQISLNTTAISVGAGAGRRGYTDVRLSLGYGYSFN